MGLLGLARASPEARRVTIDAGATTRLERVLDLRACGGASADDVIATWAVTGGEAAVLLAAAGTPGRAAPIYASAAGGRSIEVSRLPRRSGTPPAPSAPRGAIRATALLRHLLSDPAYLGLDLSPLQSALVDLAGAGRWPVGELETHRATSDDDQAEIDAVTEVRRFEVGGGSIRYRARLGTAPDARPDSVCVVAGIRGGKTTIAGSALVTNALEADLSALRRNEVAYGVIVAPTLEAADKTFEDLCDLIRSTPLREREVVPHFKAKKKKSDDEADDGPLPPANRRIRIRRDDGRHVVLRVVAASKGGLTSRSRWLVGCVLEEAAYFGSEGAGAAVSAEDQYAAVADRIVPGGQVWLISSPNAPEGLLYETWRRVPEGWAVVHAPTRALNPSYPQERVARAMRRNADRARRDLGAEFLDSETALIPNDWIERATVPLAAPVAGQVAYDAARRLVPGSSGGRRVAAMDPATRGNGWTMVVAERTAAGAAIVSAREWRGSKATPLSPSETLQAIAAELRRWGISVVLTDRHHVDSLRDLARPHGLQLSERTTNAGDGIERGTRIRSLLGDRTLTLCDVPELARDLRSARRILTRHGSALLLPTTPDGRHCDYFPSVSLAVWELRTAPAPEVEDEEDEFEHGLPVNARRPTRAERPWSRA